MTAEPAGFWFGRGRARCFGVLQRPEGEAARRGVVVCNGLGYEGLIAGRPLRELADRLVGLGFAVLRFDYQGTGDSDGGDWEPGRVKEWAESIDEAVAVMRVREGVDEVYLVGFRIGATLACRYAHDHPGVAGVALWAPCADGATYVRELRALSRLSAAARPPQKVTADYFPDDSIEVAGFELARATADDLRAIRLVEPLERSPAPGILIIDHPDRPAPDSLIPRLVELGTAVEHVRVAGYAEFMVEDETKSTLPQAALDAMTAWFAHMPPRPDRVAIDAPQVSPTLLVVPRLLVADSAPVHRLAPGLDCPPVTEEAVRVANGLFAIVTEPVASDVRRPVAVLMLNTGLTNRVGQGRLSVEQARYWASLGFTAVRLDLGGTGESPAPAPSPTDVAALSKPTAVSSSSTYSPERTKEVARVVDWLRARRDITTVVLFGICSGAYHSFHAALEGAAIDSAILVNPAIWYNDNFRRAGLDIQVARNATAAIFQREEWRRVIREPRATLSSMRQAASGFRHLVRVRVGPWLRKVGLDREPVSLSADLNRIVGRGIDLLIVFAAAEMGEQYLRTFGAGAVDALQAQARLRIVNIDGGDHVFSAPGARQELIQVVTRHLEDRYPFDPPAAGLDPGGGAPQVGVNRPDEGSPLTFGGVDLPKGSV